MTIWHCIILNFLISFICLSLVSFPSQFVLLFLPAFALILIHLCRLLLLIFYSLISMPHFLFLSPSAFLFFPFFSLPLSPFPLFSRQAPSADSFESLPLIAWSVTESQDALGAVKRCCACGLVEILYHSYCKYWYCHTFCDCDSWFNGVQWMCFTEIQS